MNELLPCILDGAADPEGSEHACFSARAGADVQKSLPEC